MGLPFHSGSLGICLCLTFLDFLSSPFLLSPYHIPNSNIPTVIYYNHSITFFFFLCFHKVSGAGDIIAIFHKSHFLSLLYSITPKLPKYHATLSLLPLFLQSTITPFSSFSFYCFYHSFSLPFFCFSLFLSFPPFFLFLSFFVFFFLYQND